MNDQLINYLKKPTRRLKTAVFLMVFFFSVNLIAQNQSQPISIQLKNATLKEFIKEIEKKTKYTVVYRDVLIDNTKDISVDMKNTQLNEVMKVVLASKKLRANYSGNTIIITKDENTDTSVQSVKENPKTLKRITGTVSSVQGEPVIGASIIQKNNPGLGSITNIDGNFSLDVPLDATLLVSYLGFKSQEINVIGKSNFQIVLQENDKMLDEVVVVGYGTQKKINLTGAVTQVVAKDIESRPASNMSSLLQGIVPNMNITFSSGRPGQGGTFNIRGNTSINDGGGTPLVLIDGVEGNIDRINPRDVESVSVLKDASASAVYGARASFGVILVTTKQGSENKTTISYGTKMGKSASTVSTDFETRGYYSALINDQFFSSYAGQNYTKYNDYDYEQLWLRVNDKTEHPDRPWVVIDQRDGRDSYTYYGNTDWYNYFFDDSRPMQEHSLNINGGTNKIKYFLSGSMFDQKGVFKINPDKYRSMNFRAKITAEVRPWLEISSNTKYFSSDYTFPGSGAVNNFFSAVNAHGLASFVPVNPDGTPLYLTSLTNYQVMDGWSALLINNKHNNRDNNYEFGTTFEAVVKLFEGTDIRANYSYSHLSSQVMNRGVNVPYSKYPGEVSYLTTGIGQDKLYEKQNNNWYYAGNVYANFERTFNNTHYVKLMAGVNYETRYLKDFSATRSDLLSTELNDFNLAVGDVMTISGGQNQYKIFGTFFRANYNYKGKYLFETSGRLDGSSRFMNGHRTGFFPSGSAAWRLSEENFFDGLKNVISNAKIRLSYGSLGNQKGVGYYDYIQTVSTGGTINYSFGDGTKASAATVSSPNASDLTWEMIYTTNLGLDMSFLKGRLDFTGDIYTRETIGMLTAGKDLPSVYGASVPKMNLANLRTNGWEVSVAWNDKFSLKNKPFHYTARFVLSDYISTITKFDNPSKLISNYYEGQRLGEIWGYVTDGYFLSDEEAANYPVNQTSVNDIINTSAGSEKGLKAGDLKFVDLNDDKVITAAKTLDDTGDQIVIGNSQPRYSFGLNLSADWQGFDFSVFFQGIGKQNWYPGRDAVLFWGPYSRPYATFIGSDFLSRVWSEDNPDAYFPRPRGYIALNATNRSLGVPSDRYLQDLAYCRIKNLNIGYSLPNSLLSKITVERVRIYFSGENLYTFTKLKSKYIDPELAASDGANGNAKKYGWSKTFSLGLDITF